MATSPNRSIDILFGVKGGGNISGESGRVIARQLQEIANSISSSEATMPKVTFQLDVAKTKSLIQSQLNSIGQGLSLPVASVAGKEGDGKGGSGSNNNVADVAKQTRAWAQLWSAREVYRQNSSKWSQEQQNAFRVEEQHLTQIQSLLDKNGQYTAEDIKKMTQLTTMLNSLSRAGGLSGAENARVGNIIAQVNREWKSFTDFYTANRTQIDSNSSLSKAAKEISEAFTSGKWTQSRESVADMNRKLAAFRKACQDAGIETQEFSSRITKLFREHFNTAIAMAAIAMLRKSLQSLIQNVNELDKAVTNLQIATGQTREETKALIREYGQLAQQLGAPVVEVAESADTWLRQGYSMEEANELIRQSMYLSKLGEIDSAAAATALTSAVKGYKLEAADAASVVDKLTAVDMEAAATAGGLATAMAETANSANLSGVSMDLLIGQIATVKEVN